MNRAGKNTKLNIPMCLACILLCATLLTTHLLSGLYARYSTQAEGEDSARVASFEIKETSDLLSQTCEIGVRPGTTEIPLTVTNKSEVAVTYIITAINETKNLPLHFAVDDGTAILDKVEYSDTMAPGETTEYKLKSIWNSESAADDMGKVDLVKLVLKAEQID